MLEGIDYPFQLSSGRVLLSDEERQKTHELYQWILEEFKKHPVKIIMPYRLENSK